MLQPVAEVEEAVADHYVTVTLPADLRERIHRGVDSALNTTATVNPELIEGIEQQITRLDAQKDQYLDLVSDPAIEKIAERLRKVLNQATFTRLYVDADDRRTHVHDDEPTDPFAPLIAVHRADQHESGGAAHLGSTAAATTTAPLPTALPSRCSSNAVERTKCFPHPSPRGAVGGGAPHIGGFRGVVPPGQHEWT